MWLEQELDQARHEDKEEEEEEEHVVFATWLFSQQEQD